MRSSLLFFMVGLLVVVGMVRTVAGSSELIEAESNFDSNQAFNSIDWIQPTFIEADADTQNHAVIGADADADADADIDAELDAELEAEAATEAEAESAVEGEGEGEVEGEAEVEGEGEGEVESNLDSNPAAAVSWEQPKAENIDHQDHRRVHVTLMAQHLDIAHEQNRLGNGVQVIGHVDAADKHNIAAEAHRQADQDPDFIKGAVDASRAAFKKTRSLIRRSKPKNMVPKAEQPTPAAAAAVKELANMKPAELAPEAIAKRQYLRSIGKDHTF